MTYLLKQKLIIKNKGRDPMLSEISYAIEKFNSLPGYELSFFEKEILGYAYFADGEIQIVNNKLGQPYIRISSVHYNFNTKIKASYRNGLVNLIKKGFAENWNENIFILTNAGWHRAEKIVNETKKIMSGYYCELDCDDMRNHL